VTVGGLKNHTVRLYAGEGIMDNVFYAARLNAAKKNTRLMSREGAAELLGLSVSTLANYELGLTKVIPPDSVVMMADLYNAPELKCYYCANECPIGQGMPIPTNHCRIEQVAVRAYDALSSPHLDEAKKNILSIFGDGKLTEENESTIERMIAYTGSLVKTLYELRLACQKLLSEGDRKTW